MANTKKKTVKTEKEKSTTTEPEVMVKEETTETEVKEDAVAADNEAENTAPVEEQVKEDVVAEEEPARKKRKYTKRAVKESKSDKAAPKKSKKDAKEAENIKETYLEFGDNKILIEEEVTEKIKQAYKNEGHRISSIKKLQVYMNIDERKAYYVINDKAEGKYVEF